MVEGVQLLKNKAINDFKIALKKLRESQALFAAAEEWDVVRILKQRIPDLEEELMSLPSFEKVKLHVKKELPTKHPLEKSFLDSWAKTFPEYGQPNGRDFKFLKDMFRTMVTSHPHANEAFILRLVQNFNKSTAGWCKTKELHIFANNFRKFIEGPVVDFGTVEINTSDRKSIPEGGFAGMSGIRIQRKPK